MLIMLHHIPFQMTSDGFSKLLKNNYSMSNTVLDSPDTRSSITPRYIIGKNSSLFGLLHFIKFKQEQIVSFAFLTSTKMII